MKLKFVNRTQIDTSKWNYCVKNSVNSLVYAYSWYLDIVADNWSAIINEDYSCVMPIIWRKKFFFKYTYRAFLVQQLGVFYLNNVHPDYKNFINILFKKNFIIDYNFNSFNNISFKETSKNTNFELNLNKPYEKLYSNFSKKHKSTIIKAKNNKLSISKDITIDAFIDFKKKYLKNKLNDKNFETLKNLYNKFPEKIVIYGVFQNREIVSSSLYFFQDNRIYFLSAVSSEKGKKANAAFFLKDTFIKDFSGKNFILDFEGSNIPGVKHFFKAWGTKPSIYQSIKSKKLSFFNNFNFFSHFKKH